MNYPIRKELVGKRFMCVRDRTTQNSRPNSRSNRFSNPLDYTWKCGIIRACSKEDSNDIEQKVLVEYDNQDWSSREWISIYKETWKIFLVEERMVWAQREDPNNPKRPILWPALTFYSLVDKHGLDESNSIGVEFLGDHMRTFCTSNEMRQYQEDDGLQPALRNNSKVVNELMNWQTLQKSQGILIHGPFTLTGFRVQVYREKCRQWFSAVITSHDLITREMDVMDDTVLQTHRINPRLVMVLLLANEVELDSMLRGDLVRVLPSRRNRQSVVITSPSPETNNSGNSMWQFLNDMWNEPHACHSGQDSSARYSSSLTVNKAPATTQEGTTAKSATQKRRKSNTSRQSKRKSSEYTESPQPNQPTSNLRLLSPYQNQENTSTHQNHMSSPVQSSLGHSSSSGHHLSSPISSPVHHRSHYSSMEDLLRTSSSPSRQHISPQRPSSASLIHPSPQRPYSSPQKTPPHVRLSPGDQQTATSKMVDPKHGLLGSPSHSNMRQYTPPHSSASLSPFRASEVFATPVLQQQHQLHQQQQQQIKQHQNLSHCQMYISQLQLLAERLKSVQQGALTPDQREMLNLLYKHILLQYQEASMSDYHSPAVAAARLQMQMQLKYLEDQEKQLKYMRQAYLPSFEPEHLKSFLSPNAVGSNTEHLQNLCASFSLQQHNQELQEVTKNFDQNKPTVKEHVARLKRFMPILQHQDNNDAATPASSSVTFPSSLKSSSGELHKKSSCYAASPSNNPSTISHICLKEEDNKTDDQKVVAALVNSKSSVPEKDVLISQSQDLSSNILATSRSVTSPKSETSQKSKDINCLHSKKEQNDDPFGFDQIGDDSSPNSKQSTGTNSKQSTGTNSKPTTGTNSKQTTVTKSKPTIGTISKPTTGTNSKPTTDTNSKPTTSTNSKPTTGMDLSSDLSQNMKDDIVNQIVPMKTDIGVDSPNQSLEKDDVTLEQKQNENLVSSILEPVQTNSIITSSAVVQDSFTKDNKNLQPQAITPCPINKNTFKEKTKSKLSTKNQKQLSSVVSPCMTSTSNSDNKKTNATCTLNTLQSIESIEEDKKPATQQANFIINKTENDVTSNRASVIKYIDRKCGSKVKTSFDSLGDSKDKSVTSPTGSLPFSVSQLLEFHKTSAQAAVKVFEEQNNSALDVHGNPQLSQEKAKGMKRKRKKRDKVFPECEGKTPEKSSSQRTLQLPGAQKLFSGPHQDNSPDSKTTISSSQDLVSRFLGHEGKSKFFPELNIVVTSQSLSQEALQSKNAINIPKIEKTTCEQNKSRAVEEQKCHDWRMTRENRSLTLNSEKPSQKEVSKSSVPVNFVADQTVRSLTTVNRAQEPVALSSLIGTEQNVEQIRREDSEDDMSKALSEQRRQRKKSRKVLENESMDESNEKRKPKSNSEPRKRKKGKLVDKDNSKNMDGSDNGETKPDVVKVTKKRVRKKDKEESLDKESSLLVDPKDKVQREIFSSEQTSQEADCKSIKGELQADSEVKVVSEKVKPEDEQKENNEKTHCNQESKIDLQSQENESFKPVLQRSWSEDTIELNLECGERMNDVTNENDSVDLSATKYSLPEDTNNAVPDEKGKSIVFHGVSTIKDECITEEKPLKEIIDKLAAKKKIGNKKPHKRKRTQENSEGQEIKKRKVKEPAEEFFIQSDNCAMFPKLPRCRDCRDREDDTGLSPTQNCCRFALFRRLKKKRRSGKIHVAGFMMPENAEQEDLTPWIASDDVSSMLSKDGAHYILSNIADEFCSLVQEEKGAKNSRGDGAVISYKRAVGGFREMCDACATTIFNIHWVCHRCGFGVCLDCYNLRVQEKINTPQFGRKMFQFKWFHCIPGLSHQPKNLTIAQIIPKEVLNDLSDKLHQIRSRWNIGKDCPCQYKQLNRGEDPEESKPELADGLNHVCKMLPTSPKAELKSDPENQETKKTLMEKVRERIKERMGANKIEENGTNPSSNFDETKHEKEHKKPSDESEQITHGSGKVSQTTLDENKITDEQKCTGASQTVTLIGACSESPKGILPTGDKDLIKEEKRSREELVNNTLEGLSGFSSGLTLLQNYDSSSEDSPENSPQTCLEQPGPTNSAFDFNLGLLALVASKRTEDHRFGQQLDNKEDVLPAVDKGVEEQKLMNWFKKETSEQISIKTENDVSSNNAVTATKGEASCSSITSDNMGTRDHTQPSLSVEEYPAPHSFMCNRRLLRLHEPHHPGNQDAFAKRWIEGKPILVSNIDKLLDRDLWSPESFEKEFGEEIADVVNCRTGKTVENFRVGDFWKGFECVKERALDSSGEPMLLKLKDWPPGDDFCEKLPSRFQNLMDNIPLPAYTRRDGLRNLASRLPSFFVKPDLGPKMYNAYGSAAHPNEGTTNLHIDMSDAVNIMVYVGVPRDEGAGEKERAAAIKAVDIACDEIQQQRVRRETARIGALWHIFEVDDADKIREFLLEVGKERKLKYSTHHDPIHDQCFYLDEELLERLKRDHNVEGYAICQCLGDGVFIPAGAPHQVRNLYSCVKIAEDFVSPERIGQCFKTTQEFRHLSDKHTNHEDKLQIKNIIYHAVKDAVSVLEHHEKLLQEQNNTIIDS